MWGSEADKQILKGAVMHCRCIHSAVLPRGAASRQTTPRLILHLRPRHSPSLPHPSPPPSPSYLHGVHGGHVLPLVVPDVHKHVVQGLGRNEACAGVTLCLELIEQVPAAS